MVFGLRVLWVILRTPSTGGAEARLVGSLRWPDGPERRLRRSGETGASGGCYEAVALRNWRGGLVFGL